MTNEMVDSVGFISPQAQSQLLQVKSQFQENYLSFTLIVGFVMLLFSGLFSWLMNTIVNITIKEYKEQVQNKEESLEKLNLSLHERVKRGIEESLEKDKAILRQSRLARLGSMISMIAHQWRQPLSELSATLMEMEMASKFQKLNSKKVETSLARCNDRIDYMSQTIDDFRNFYKPDKEKSLFSLHSACLKALNLSSATLKNANVSVSVEPRIDAQIWGYPTEFAQALLSIITNAKDVLQERKIPHPQLNIEIGEIENEYFVTLEDNGGGINEDALESLFDPYFSTKESSKGTGMGLYIAKVIVEEKMGGVIGAENKNDGARFSILFKKESVDA